MGAFCHEARLKCDNALFAKEGFVTDFFTRELEAFAGRPLEEPFAYLILDARYS